MSQTKTKKQFGTIAFITTPLFRDNRAEEIQEFACSKLYSVFKNFKVITTGRTRSFLKEFIEPPTYADLMANNPKIAHLNLIDKIIADTGQTDPVKAYAIWKSTINSGLSTGNASAGLIGMVEIICMVIDGKLDAVIHLTDWLDKAGKMDSAVLSREANVHNTPIATDVQSAEMFVDIWIRHIKKSIAPFESFKTSKTATTALKGPLQGITDKHHVLALIAHDGKKIEICQFVVQHADEILNKYDYILATGTTGTYIKKFMIAKGTNYGVQANKKIRCCKSGPVGGDLQIALAVVKGLCQDIIFFQDPIASHPHDSDIRLLEQAVLTAGVHARLATNHSSAKMLISY